MIDIFECGNTQVNSYQQDSYFRMKVGENIGVKNN